MKKIFDSLDYHAQTGKVLASVERDGFEFRASMKDDECADLSHLGEFSNSPADKFSIKHDGGRGTFEYFNAENVSDDNEAKQNYDRARTYNETWVMYGLVVNVYKKDVKLAGASLWGIESDSGEEYFLQVFNDLADEALTQAQEKLKELVS